MPETTPATVKRRKTTDADALGITGGGTTVDATDKTIGTKAEGAEGAADAKYVSSIGATTDDIQALSRALARQYENAQYAARTDEERQAQAQLEYSTYYDQLRRAASQEQEQNDLRLAQQRDALQASYDRQRDNTAQQYRQAYSQADQQLLARGMGRSSYGLATLSNVALQGIQAQSEIDRQQTEAESDIEDRRTQLSEQLQKTLSGYEAEQARDILKRVGELEQQDYERDTKAAERQTSIAQQLYQNLYQAQRDTVADAQWLIQQNEAIRQFNIGNAKGSKYEESSGMISGAGTNTSADTYYDVAESTKKKGSGSSHHSDDDDGGGGNGKPKTPKKDTLLDTLNNLGKDKDSGSSSKTSGSKKTGTVGGGNSRISYIAMQ